VLLVSANTAPRGTWVRTPIALSVGIITRHSFQEWDSKTSVTFIFYQAGHRDIQKDINLEMRDWSFRGLLGEKKTDLESLCDHICGIPGCR